MCLLCDRASLEPHLTGFHERWDLARDEDEALGFDRLGLVGRVRVRLAVMGLDDSRMVRLLCKSELHHWIELRGGSYLRGIPLRVKILVKSDILVDFRCDS